MPLAHRGWFHMGIDHWYDPGLDGAVAAWFRRHKGRAMIVEYAFLSRAFLAAPRGTLRLLDTHDILGNRHKRLLAAGLAPDWFFTSPREESRGLRRAHRVLAIQSTEAKHFEAIVGAQRVFTVGHLLDLHEPEDLPPEPSLVYLPRRTASTGMPCTGFWTQSGHRCGRRCLLPTYIWLAPAASTAASKA